MVLTDHIKLIEANLALAFRLSDAASMEVMLAGHDPNLLLVELAHHVSLAGVAFAARLKASTIVEQDLSRMLADLFPGQLDRRVQYVDKIQLCVDFLLKSAPKVIILHRVATLLQKLDHLTQVDMLRHLG
jgi:hypothetical protein